MTQILIAEDDSHLCAGLVALFESEGYTCFAASDGAAALALYEEHQPDFCIIDRMLPILDGDELCRQLRARNASVPLLMLSARSEELDRIHGFELGADDYVTKPFSARELVARVCAILKRVPAKPATERFRIGDLEVDTAQQRAMRNDVVIELHAREITILRYFSEVPQRVVSRDELMDVAWGRAYFSSSRAVDQYVSSLRKKIERNPRKPQLITTVWGQGYRYDPPA